MSSSWSIIGLNPASEAVRENTQGEREVATLEGWRPENALEPWRALRIQNPEAARMFMASLCHEPISASFQHQWKRAYLLALTPKGHQTPPALPAHQHDSYLNFERQVRQHLGSRVHRAWLHQRERAPGVPRWEQAIRSHTFQGLRGHVWGLAHRLEEAVAQTSTFSHLLVEVGLNQSDQAATARLSEETRRLIVRQPGEAWMPAATLLSGWPEAKSSTVFKAGAKVPKPEPLLASHECPIVWATPAVMAALGQPSTAWVKAVGSAPKGVLVLAVNDTSSPYQEVLKAWKNQGTLTCVRVDEELAFWFHGWPHISSQRLTLAQWAALPERVAVIAPPLALEGTKVSYQPASKVGKSEGVASLGMMEGMRGALTDFERRHPEGVDAFVAQALGETPDKLGEILSPEQVDSVALALQSFDNHLGMLIADETGFGKGRILASLALAGLRAGKTVVMLTENSQLFSDIYRDLLAVSRDRAPLPTLLHQQAKLYHTDGRQILKPMGKGKMTVMLEEKQWREGVPRLILTTYSQLSRKWDDAKLGWLKHRMGDEGWLLLDEAHNAAGQSSIAERVGALIKKAKGVAFGSATYAKSEANLQLYKPVLGLSPQLQRLLFQAMAGDKGLLREVLAQQLARSGRLVRREHPPVPPPAVAWVSLNTEQERHLEAFGAAWSSLFEVVQRRKSHQDIQESFWQALGGAISRSAKEFTLLMKMQALVDHMVRLKQEDKKSLVVVDITMESALRQALTPNAKEGAWSEEEEDRLSDEDTTSKVSMIMSGEGKPPLWRDKFSQLLNEIAPEEWAASYPDVQTAVRVTQGWIAQLPDWDLSPLDWVRHRLEEQGVRCGELSGRLWRLEQDEKGWAVQPRKDPERHASVAAFNRGDLDAMLITRSGCAGISLHAGQRFQDQRVRCLVEWDIAANAVSRIQFWGRVRRKDQVVEPEFIGLALDTPEQRRILEKEERKRQQMAAHAGDAGETTISWVGDTGEQAVEEWSRDRPWEAFRLGVYRPLVDQPHGRVDRALIRSLVLPQKARQWMTQKIERAIDVGAVWEKNTQTVRTQLPSRVLRTGWWWGDPNASQANPADSLTSLRLDWVERVWNPSQAANLDEVVAWFKQGQGSLLNGQEVLSLWQQAWTEDARIKLVNPAHRQQIWPRLQAILPHLQRGHAVTFLHPLWRRPVYGVIGGWDLPEHDRLWGLSQVGLWVWTHRDREPLLVPVRELLKDPSFKALGKAQGHSFQLPPIAERWMCMEGHPVQAAAWGRRWNQGRSMLVQDIDDGAKLVWCMPHMIDWDKAWKLPRDLIDHEHALSFWKAHPKERLTMALPHGQSAFAEAAGAKWRWVVQNATLEAWKNEWMHPKMARELRWDNVKGTPGWSEVSLPWKLVVSWMARLNQLGLGWRCEAKFAPWYEKTSTERMAAIQEADRQKMKRDKEREEAKAKEESPTKKPAPIKSQTKTSLSSPASKALTDQQEGSTFPPSTTAPTKAGNKGKVFGQQWLENHD